MNRLSKTYEDGTHGVSDEWSARKNSYAFSSIDNGAYKKVDVDKSTIEAIEYAFTIGDTTNGATYFHSDKSKWHENNIR